MSFLQISPQLIKVKQNSNIRGWGGAMGIEKMQRKHYCALQLISLESVRRWKEPTPLLAPSVKGQEAFVWQQGQAQSGLWRVIHRLAGDKWDDGGICCSTHYPVNSPVSAAPNSLGLRAPSPFLHFDNRAIAGNSSLTARWWHTGWKTEQIWKMCPINA